MNTLMADMMLVIPCADLIGERLGVPGLSLKLWFQKGLDHLNYRHVPGVKKFYASGVYTQDPSG